MFRFIRRPLERRVLLGAAVSLFSLLLVAFGLYSVVSALRDDNVSLPQEGTIDDIVSQATGPALGDAAVTPAPPLGPLPVRMVVPRLYMDAPVIAMGVDAENNPEVPGRPDQVAWYTFTATPASDSNAVFTGHVDWQTRTGAPIPGVFYRLRELQIGDDITLTLEDGSEATYRVTGNVATKYDDPNVVRSMGPTSKDVITLITCGGTWLAGAPGPYGGNYSHRVVVRAELVTPAVAAAPAG